MHVRSGMATRYLSEEFMHLIKSCVKKGEEIGLLPWLYDEDRWPSGQAGGFATKEFKNRMKYIVFTPALEEYVPFEEAVETGKPYLLSAYDVVLNSDGTYSFTKGGHSGADVPLFVYGSNNFIEDGETVNNIDIPARIAYSLGFGNDAFPYEIYADWMDGVINNVAK